MNLLYILFKVALYSLPFVVLGFAATWAATRFSIRAARKVGAIAGVNERSSHSKPVPRLGGVGLVAGLVLGPLLLLGMIAIADRIGPQTIKPIMGEKWFITPTMVGGMIVSVLLAFLLGLWDDLKNPPALLKLAGQLIISAVPVAAGLRINWLYFPGMNDVVNLPPTVSIPLTMLWVFFVMNAVNFMDGINGLAVRFAQLVVAMTLAGTVILSGASPFLIPPCATVYGAGEGFLLFNRTPARVFLGDCGSQALGAYIALLGVMVTNLPTSHPRPFLGFVIITSVFLFDVVYTLVRRAMRKENLLKAHRDHLYQRHLKATGENHEHTRIFVEGYILITGVIGAFYLLWGWNSSRLYVTVELILLAAAALTLAAYARKVVEAEKQAA